MTREEAIKEIKSWDFLNKKETEAIETLIPELRESDDEEMTEFEQSVYDLCPVLGIEEAKATASDLLELAKETLLKTGKVVLTSNYPEGCSFEDGFHLGYNEGFNAKQEQKPAEYKTFKEWVEDYWSHNKVNNPYSYNKGDEIQFDHKGFVSFCEAYCCPQNLVLHDTFGYEEGRQTGQNEGVKLVLNNPEKYGLQKEQKPAEWSRQSIIDALTKWLTEKIAPLHKKSLDKTITEREEMFMAALLEMRSLVNSPDFQIGKDMPAEWSEQDIQYYDAVMDMITNARYLPCRPRDEIVEWFKSLKNRGNFQKSNSNSPSWSKEDEEMIRSLILEIDKYAFFAGIESKKIINFLKSLCPPQYCENCKLRHSVENWKPSEEQMGALNYAYCELFKREDVGHNILGPLQNLIDTLRKL